MLANKRGYTSVLDSKRVYTLVPDVIYYYNTYVTDGVNYKLILGIVAALLFILILIAIIVIMVKYNR